MAGIEFGFRRGHIEHLFSGAFIKMYMLLCRFHYLYDGFFLIIGFVLACDIEMQLGNLITSVLWLNLVCNNMTKDNA